MRNLAKYLAVYLLIFVVLISCSTTKKVVDEAVYDSVCGMMVKKSESYVWKFDGSKYYFDSYDCKEAFKMNPKSFIEKKCIPNNNINDLVCGAKVNLSESYDMKYSGKVYHFHSNDCKQAFKMNPEKFLKNKCEPIDSLKK